MKTPSIRAALALPVVWITALYLVPLGVGYAVKAVPLRLVSSGILFDQTAVSFPGYMAIVWSPVIAGLLFAFVGGKFTARPFLISAGIAGAALAATLMLAGGALGIGPGTTLLLGTELRWIWKLTIGLVGVAAGLVGPLLLKAHAEDHALDFGAIKKGLLVAGAVIGALVLTFGPGPLLGRAITGGGSWLGSLFWLVTL